MSAGTGGTPPRPPGYQEPPLPGTAAGSANIFRGRLVLVFGPAGALVGIFVYAAGTTPAFGNPPIFWATSGTADPFGNPLPSTVGVAGAGQFRAGNTIINSNGIFIYSGAPALDNLLISHVPGVVNVNDPFGNSALPGSTSYGGSTGNWVALNMQQGGQLTWFTSVNADMTGWVQQGQIVPSHGIALLFTNTGFGFTFGTTGVNEPVEVIGILQLAKVNALPLTFPNMVQLFADPTTSALTRVLPSGFTDRISGAQGDHTRFTVTQTGSNQLTKAWDIPAADSQNDTHYRLIAWGKGTWGSTLQQLSTNVSGGHAGCNTPTTAQGASANFFWKAILDLHIEVATAGGSATWNMVVHTSQGGTNGYSALGNSEAGAWNATIDNTIALFTGWAATTGGPTITCDGSTFERLGR